jgi:hypothetical protein
MSDKDSQSAWNSIKDTWNSFRNPLTVDLLESRLTKQDTQISSLREELVKQENMFENMIYGSINSKQQRTLWNSIYQRSITKKSEVIKEVIKAQKSFLHTAILDVLVTDSIAPNAVTGDVVHISSDNEPINKELIEFQKKFDLDSLVLNIIDDLISYGEYYLSVVGKDGEGVTEIHDNIDQGEVVSVYKGFSPSKFLKMDAKKTGKSVGTADADSMIHFCLGTKKLRIKVENLGSAQKLEEYVRIGRPLFFGVFDLLTNLTLLTNLVPATYVQKINNTSIIGVQMAEGTDPKKAFSICRRYEQVLNKLTSFDSTTGDITVSDVISAAGKFKCFPVIGDKGRLEKNDPRYEEITDVTVLQELKKDIMGAIGVPYNFIYSGDLLKGDTLKQFARYVRKLHSVQMAITNGLKQLVTIHLKYKGKIPAADHLNVKFTNALVSVDELDKLEFLSTLTAVLGEITTTFKTIATESQGTVNGSELQKFLDRHLKIVNLEKLITLPKGEIKAIESNTDEIVEQIKEFMVKIKKVSKNINENTSGYKEFEEKVEKLGKLIQEASKMSNH